MIVGTADGGLRYAVKRSGNAVGYCSLTIKCGTRDEGDFHSGIAHFTEHTLFKGTERKSAKVISGYLDRLGGELNAFTTKEEIVIHSTVLKEDLGKAASLLLELATCPTFPEEEIAVEKGVVIDEINSYKDSPADDVYDKFEEALFAGHPLGRSILGTAASVKKITSKELRQFTKEHFVPMNMALAIVADIDEKKLEESVLKLVGKVFKNEPATGGERIVTPIPVKPAFNKQVEKRNHEVNAVIGNFAPSLDNTEERFAAILIQFPAEQPITGEKRMGLRCRVVIFTVHRIRHNDNQSRVRARQLGKMSGCDLEGYPEDAGRGIFLRQAEGREKAVPRPARHQLRQR